VLDTSRGLPAQGVGVTLEIQSAGAWRELSRRTTDADGRVRDLLSDATKVDKGIYRLIFDTGAYFRAQSIASFHPRISVEFEVREPAQHHHVPLLLSPFGYTTYRGS
jgi:5-hydroxyisourate hydrolase